MSWLVRWLFLGGAISVGVSCGESGGPRAEPAGTELTVLIPSGGPGRFPLASAITSVEYSIQCDSDEMEGALSQVGLFDGGPKGTTAVWKGTLSTPSGACEIRLIGRDGDGEAICPVIEPLPAASEWPPELFIELPCYKFGCTATPLPSSVVDKSCLSIVGVILSAEIPAALERPQRVEYVISELWDQLFLEDDPVIFERYRGELAAAGVRGADFGGGLEPTIRWETALEDVPAVRYLIELTAFDAEGAAACTVERRLEILADAIAQIEVAMPCRDAMENPP